MLLIILVLDRKRHINTYISNICSFLLQFPSPNLSEESPHENMWKEDIKSTVNDILNTESNGQCTRY